MVDQKKTISLILCSMLFCRCFYSVPILASSPWCQELTAEFRRLHWDTASLAYLCSMMTTLVKAYPDATSIENRPLVYLILGSQHTPANTTLILSSVHGDEITPVFVALRYIQWLVENPKFLQDKRIIIAPIVNPDGFLRRPKKTRVNARGVDINRNFPTSDWDADAHRLWRSKYGANPRRFPGIQASSEPETKFQQWLIEGFKPKKILSIHSPLNFVDYDGPSSIAPLQHPRHVLLGSFDKFKKEIKAIAGGFFTGSLGHYAGYQLKIPTVTLELPDANPAKAHQYWKQFKPTIDTVMAFDPPDQTPDDRLLNSLDKT